MTHKLRSLALLALVLVALLAGCGKHVRLYAATTTFPSGVQVYLQQADIRGDRLYVQMKMLNMTKDLIHIDRDGMALRLPNGVVLPRSSGVTTQHKRYDLPPGTGHDVFVDFRAAEDLTPITGATVIVGGISFGADPSPRIVGELPLTTTYPQSYAGEPAPPAMEPAAPAATQPAAEPAPAAPGKDI